MASFRSIKKIGNSLKGIVFNIITRHSALFVNGEKAVETYAVVTPHVDFQERLAEEEKLQGELAARKSNIDLDQAKDVWQFYQMLLKHKTTLEEKRMKINELIERLRKEDEIKYAREIDKLKVYSSTTKEDLKTLKPSLWTVEESAYLRALSLPNKIHPNTPFETDNVIHSFSNKPDNALNINHIEEGIKQTLLHYISPEQYYLLGDAALFEMGVNFHFSRELRRNRFTQFSNPDFSKSVIVEGCGFDHRDPRSSLILHPEDGAKVNPDIRMHLTGGASLHAFMSYHTKHVLHSKVLPLKYFSAGRQYTPVPVENLELGLFSVIQSSAIEIFSVSKNNDAEFEQLLSEVSCTVKNLYESLGYHFRMCYLTADKLLPSESLRLSIQMYSTGLQDYVEVGNVSVLDAYLSKRLMFTYTEDKVYKFPKIISGTVLNVPKLVGSVIEQSREFKVPDIFKPPQWKT